MSSRRSSRPRHLPPSSRITADERINDLLSKLQALISQDPGVCSNDRANSTKVLQEACSYIRSLHSEVDELSERLSELLDTAADHSSAHASIIRSLLI